MIAVGQTIGNYMLTAKLGEGGMGVVYLAEHPVIGRKVAMKAIHPELSRNPEVVSRFVTEAKAVNQIGNEHIVDIHDFGTTGDGEFYFVMEFLQGEALSDHLKRSAPLEAARALAIAAQVADALGASHEHGIIHRDLKPENIFLITKSHTSDFVKVLDFGLAKLTQGDEKVSHKTRTGSVMGTPYYMSPEQCEGKANIDHRADIYSLGVILFEMLTAKVPFGGEGYGEIIVKHITAPVPSPRAINPLLQPSVEAVIMRALAKRREDRFQSMEELAKALLDPETYAATAPAFDPHAFSKQPTAVMEPAGATPIGRADSVVSGQVLYGNAEPELGARPAPIPSTFRHAAGELTPVDEDDFDAPKPRRKAPLLLAALGAMAVAAAAAYHFTQGSPAEQPPSPAPTVVTRPMPATPKTIKLSFASDPTGATVLNKDTNQEVGVTPFSVDVPSGSVAIEYLFKKDGYNDKVESYVPAESGQIAVSLAPVPPPAKEPAEARAEDEPRAKRAARPTRRKAVSARRRPERTLDEDGVLAPSF
jgi:tRNA A-37 threonylcarbamoyl transferase component Bud32